MADAALGVVTGLLLRTVLSLATEEITLAWGLDKELTKLAQKVKMIQALLSDAQSKQVNDEAVQVWLEMLQSAALDAQIVLDEFGYQVLRQKIESRKRDKVCPFFSSSKPVSFRSKLAHEVKDVMSSFEKVYDEANRIGLKAVELKNSLPDPKEKRLTDPFVEDSEIVGRDDDTSQVKKDRLIQLWMAQGLLNPRKGSDTRFQAANYLNIKSLWTLPARPLLI